MEKANTYVGLDVHKDEIVVSMLIGEGSQAIEWKAAHDGRGVRRLVRRLEQRGQGEIECAYEAPPSAVRNPARGSSCSLRGSGAKSWPRR